MTSDNRPLDVPKAFQLLLASAWRFSHFSSQKVETMRRTMRNDPKLAYEDKYFVVPSI
jgi:hypothetical protein